MSYNCFMTLVEWADLLDDGSHKTRIESVKLWDISDLKYLQSVEIFLSYAGYKFETIHVCVKKK